MNTLTRQQQLLIGAVLMLALIITRSHLLDHLLDGSWAIFFLVGFYLRSRPFTSLAFPLFFLAAFSIDLLVIDAQGGQHYCFTPSYPFLVPAYAMMWYSGRWLAGRLDSANGLSNLALSAFISISFGIVTCFAISNASFYLFSGKFAEMGAIEYIRSVARYLPQYLQTSLLYLGFTALIHVILLQTRKMARHAHHS